MGEVVVLGGLTTLPIPVERVCDGAKHLEYVLVLGWTKDGEMHTASSDGELQRALWIVTKFMHKLHAGDYG
jgi:hypothetical protein